MRSLFIKSYNGFIRKHVSRRTDKILKKTRGFRMEDHRYKPTVYN